MDKSHRTEVIGLFGVGALMLVIAVFFDPVGSNPDSGLIELSPMQAKWLLGVLGGAFVAGGVWTLLKSARSK